jgi:hypothetical protein
VLGSNTIDVAIGLGLIYLTLSLAVTAAQELIASLLKSRANALWKGVKNLLGDDALAEQLYDHPLVRSLRTKHGRPSYIPSRTFAVAVLDGLTPPGQRTDAAHLANRCAEPHTRFDHTLSVLWAEAGGNLDDLKTHIEVWFNQGMERVGGRYKRQAQWMAAALALAITLAANADTASITTALSRDPTLRASLVANAQTVLQSAPQSTTDITSDTTSTPIPPPRLAPEEIDIDVAEEHLAKRVADIKKLGLPLGWAKEWQGDEGHEPRVSAAISAHWFGWLLTAFAVSLGAPFWFDTLNRFMSIRSAGKAPEERPQRPRVVPQPVQPGEETSTK